jgi:hypothetical protein
VRAPAALSAEPEHAIDPCRVGLVGARVRARASILESLQALFAKAARHLWAVAAETPIDSSATRSGHPSTSICSTNSSLSSGVSLALR